MKNSITRTVAAFCLASACLGAATPQQTPHTWAKYDLELPIGQTMEGSIDTSAEDTTATTDVAPLEKRRQVGICEALIVAAACISIKNEIVSTVSYLANVIDDLSNRRSCGTFTGSVGSIAFRYYANGKNCDTTAEQKTIAGAIEHHLKTKDDSQVCGMDCLDLTHGGTWDGFLLIGPVDHFDASVYCGPTLDFGKCSSGGKKDFN
jgi:hypothetical protein